MTLTKIWMLALTLALVLLASGAYGIEVSAGSASSGMSSGVSLKMASPISGSVDGSIVMNRGTTQPAIRGCGDFDPTYSIQDASGKHAEVYADVKNAASYTWQAYLTYVPPQIGGIPTYNEYTLPASDTSLVIGGTVPSLAAEQQLTVSDADSIHTHATAYTNYVMGGGTDQYPVASVSLDIIGASGNKARVTNLDQKAQVSSDSSGTYARSTQTGSVGGDKITRHANSDNSPTLIHDLTMDIEGLSSGKAITISDEANADSISDFGSKSSMEITNPQSATATKTILADHRNTAERGERRVTMICTDGQLPSGTAVSQKSTHILEDMVESSLVDDGDRLEVENLGSPYKENIRVDKSLNIVGIADANGASPIIDGKAVDSVFTTGKSNTNAVITLSNLDITNGATPIGGAIDNYATLTIENCKIHDNTASGGGIMNNQGAMLTVDNTEIYNNHGTAANSDGGAIVNSGVLNVKDSYIHGNDADYGGAIFNAGTADIRDSNISSNTARKDGGAIENMEGSTVTISNSTLLGNTAGINGGAIDNHVNATVNILDSDIGSNVATRLGGGIMNDQNATLTVTGGSLHNNQAVAGGAICNYGHTTLTNVQILNNSAVDKLGDGGAIVSGWPTLGPGTPAWLKIDGCTISGNTAAFGAGIYTADTSGESYIKNSLVTNNKATIRGGGILIQRSASRSSSAIFDYSDPANVISGNTPQNVWK